MLTKKQLWRRTSSHKNTKLYILWKDRLNIESGTLVPISGGSVVSTPDSIMFSKMRDYTSIKTEPTLNKMICSSNDSSVSNDSIVNSSIKRRVKFSNIVRVILIHNKY